MYALNPIHGICMFGLLYLVPFLKQVTLTQGFLGLHRICELSERFALRPCALTDPINLPICLD